MNEDVAHVLELLVNPTVLISWPLGVKACRKKWKHLTLAHMTPAYLARLHKGNIGVALGEVSGGLCAIDIDDDRFVEPLLALNPALRNALQTHGLRGRVFWLWFTGNYPKRTIKLKSSTGADVGEFRSNGSQSIIHGIHPDTKKPYKLVVNAPAIKMDFASIKWPEEIVNPPQCSPSFPATATEEPEDTEDTEDTDESEEVARWVFSVHSVEDVLRVSTPTASRQNYRLALVLARGVKALERQTGEEFTPEQHRAIHGQWLALARPFLRSGQSHEDYFMEYLNAYQLTKFPLGSVVLAKALELATNNPLPTTALTWINNPDVRLLAALCRELQTMAGAEPFYLSARTIQNIFKHDNHATAAKWMRSFCVMKVLTEVEKGSGVRASRYRYIGEP